jgi:hypothetical protein
VLASYLENTSFLSFLKVERQPTCLIHIISVNQQKPCGQLGIEFQTLITYPDGWNFIQVGYQSLNPIYSQLHNHRLLPNVIE